MFFPEQLERKDLERVLSSKKLIETHKKTLQTIYCLQKSIPRDGGNEKQETYVLNVQELTNLSIVLSKTFPDLFCRSAMDLDSKSSSKTNIEQQEKIEEHQCSSVLQESMVLKCQNEDLTKQLQEIREVSRNENKMLKQMQADFINFRRRQETREKELRSLLREDILLKILSVMDNLEQALKSYGGEKEREFKLFYQGVELINQQLQDVVVGYGVEIVSSIGKEFNPEIHEAIQILNSGDDNVDQSKDVVVEEWQKACLLGRKILRHGKVVVRQASKGKEGDASCEGK